MKDVTDLLDALPPLAAFVFITRCAMRARFATFSAPERSDLLEALTNYDASIDDAVSFCLLPGGWDTKIQMAKGIIESSRPRYRNAAIEEAFICVSHIDSPRRLLVRSAYTAFYEFEVAVERHAEYLRRLSRDTEASYPEPNNVYRTVLPELQKLVQLGTEQSFDPTENGPLNGLWPNGVPKTFQEFEAARPLKLRLRSESIPASIPPGDEEHDAQHSPQGGQATEPLETVMDVEITAIRREEPSDKDSEQLTDKPTQRRKMTPQEREYWEPILALTEQAILNRSQIDPELLAAYAGQWVAWSPDGSRIVAHADKLEDLDPLVIAAGEDPDLCTLEGIEV